MGSVVEAYGAVVTKCGDVLRAIRDVIPDENLKLELSKFIDDVGCIAPERFRLWWGDEGVGHFMVVGVMAAPGEPPFFVHENERWRAEALALYIGASIDELVRLRVLAFLPEGVEHG